MRKWALFILGGIGLWDYRAMPGNFLGQLCPAYCCLWLPLSVAARALYHGCDQALARFSSG